VLEKFFTDVFRSVFYSTVRILGIHIAQTFLKPSSLMVVITAGFPSANAAHSSLFVVRRSSHISALTFSLVPVASALVVGRCEACNQCPFYWSYNRGPSI
jgi:hypothetical protein